MALVLPSLVMVAMIFPYCHSAWSKVFISVSAFFFVVGSGSGGLCFLVLRAAFHPSGQNKRAWKHVLHVPTKTQKAVRFFFLKEPPICFHTISLSHSGMSSFPFLPDSWILEMGSSTRSNSYLHAAPAELCRAGGGGMLLNKVCRGVWADVVDVYLLLLLFLSLNLIYYLWF